MSNITQFPIPALPISQITPVASSEFKDIVVADQAGVTGTESLQQIFDLFLPGMFLAYAGNPNGNVAGIAFQTCFDLTTQILYVCTVTGNATSAIWRQCIATSNMVWFNIVSGSSVLFSNAGFVANSSITTTFTLPATSLLGDLIYIVGRQNGWVIEQLAGQQIFVSPAQTTLGISGSLSSLNPRDSITMICTAANVEWQVISQQSAGLIII